jgi:hypothetical protein
VQLGTPSSQMRDWQPGSQPLSCLSGTSTTSLLPSASPSFQHSRTTRNLPHTSTDLELDAQSHSTRCNSLQDSGTRMECTGPTGAQQHATDRISASGGSGRYPRKKVMPLHTQHKQASYRSLQPHVLASGGGTLMPSPPPARTNSPGQLMTHPRRSRDPGVRVYRQLVRLERAQGLGMVVTCH